MAQSTEPDWALVCPVLWGLIFNSQFSIINYQLFSFVPYIFINIGNNITNKRYAEGIIVRKNKIFFIVVLLLMMISLIIIGESVEAKRSIIGDIVSVNSNQDSILLRRDEVIKEYKVNIDTEIYLNNRSVSIKALRPIKPDAFQQAEVVLDKEGNLEKISSYYKVFSVKVENIKGREVIVKNLNTDQKMIYSISDNVKVMRNNQNVSLKDLKEGDQGLIVLGVNNRLIKLIVHHYQIKGLVKEIDYQKKEMVVNIGSRLNPKLKRVNLKDNTKIFKLSKRIEVKGLAINDWVKLELDDGVKTVVSRSI